MGFVLIQGTFLFPRGFALHPNKTWHWGPTRQLPLEEVILLRLWSGKARIAVEKAKPQRCAKGDLNSFTLFSEGFGLGKEVKDLPPPVLDLSCFTVVS